jgi:hypothetical protein
LYIISLKLLQKENLLVLSEKEYYNLYHKAKREKGRLTKKEEIIVITKYLKD